MTGRQTFRMAGRQTGTEAEWQDGIQAYRMVGRQADRQARKHTGNREAEILIDRSS